MLFKSRLDSDIKSSQELIIFNHKQERVLLPLPKTYEVGHLTFTFTCLNGTAGSVCLAERRAELVVQFLGYDILLNGRQAPR